MFRRSCARRLPQLVALVLLATAGCRDSADVSGPPSPPPTPIVLPVVDPTPEQRIAIIGAVRTLVAARKTVTPPPVTDPYRSMCQGRILGAVDFGCWDGWCLKIYFTVCGETYAQVTDSESNVYWIGPGGCNACSPWN